MGEKSRGMSKILLIISAVTAILGAVVSVFQVELWLAGTQWILVAILLAVWADASQECGCCVKKE